MDSSTSQIQMVLGLFLYYTENFWQIKQKDGSNLSYLIQFLLNLCFFLLMPCIAYCQKNYQTFLIIETIESIQKRKHEKPSIFLRDNVQFSDESHRKAMSGTIMIVIVTSSKYIQIIIRIL